MTQKKNFAKAVEDQARIEQQVKQILLVNAAPPRFNHFYMNFGKMIMRLKNKYKGDVLNNEADSLQLHWFRRGLDNFILEQIKCFYIFCEVVVMAYPYNAEDDNDNVLAGENRETIINLIYGYYDSGGIWKRVEVDNAGSLHVNVITSTDIDINDISKGAQTNDVKITLAGEKVVLGAAADPTYIGDIKFGESLPAGTNNIGDVDVLTLPARVATTDTITAKLATDKIHDGTTALTPKFAVIDDALAGNNTIVAAVSGKKIRVLSLFLISAGTVNVRFESGAGGAALTGQMNLVANTGFVLPFNPVGWFETGVNTLLNLELSAGISCDGSLVYVEV